MPKAPRTVEYVSPERLRELEPEAIMKWKYSGELRTLRMKGDRYFKGFFAEPARIRRFQEEAKSAFRLLDWYPSSWGQIFHDMAPRPARLPSSIRAACPGHVTGAWEEKRTDGRAHYDVREYDMISAYGWAGLRTLPVIRSAKPVRTFRGPGIYLGRIRRFGSVVPPPHLRKSKRLHWVTEEEIEELDLTVDIVRGLAWRRFWEPRRRIELILERITDYKPVLRAYWGSWATARGPECEAGGKKWTLPNVFQDTVSAHYIVSRVRNRIAQVAGRALHVFVDAVITTEHLPTGTDPGAWKLKNRFRKIHVRGAGNWTAPAEGIGKHAGRSHV